MITTLQTKVEVIEMDDHSNYGKFSMSPLERGYGTTIGNSLRRVLLSSLPGAAISSVKFDEGVPHEFTTIPGVLEDVPEIILNLKGVAVKKMTEFEESVKIRLDVEGPKIVTAGDITETTDVEIVNKDHYLCTLNKNGAIHMEMTVIFGNGYSLADHNKKEDDPIGLIPIDASFTPVEKVNYAVEDTRVEQITDYDRLVLEVWTNGTISPQEAVAEGARILIDHLNLLTALPDLVVVEPETEPEEEEEEASILQKPIEELELSLRSYNCLKRAKIITVDDLVSRSIQELSQIRNFGKVSIAEVKKVIGDLGLSFREDPEE